MFFFSYLNWVLICKTIKFRFDFLVDILSSQLGNWKKKLFIHSRQAVRLNDVCQKYRMSESSGSSPKLVFHVSIPSELSNKGKTAKKLSSKDSHQFENLQSRGALVQPNMSSKTIRAKLRLLSLRLQACLTACIQQTVCRQFYMIFYCIQTQKKMESRDIFGSLLIRAHFFGRSYQSLLISCRRGAFQHSLDRFYCNDPATVYKLHCFHILCMAETSFLELRGKYSESYPRAKPS